MSVDIVPNRGRGMDVTNVGWRFILEFCQQQGWIASGTRPPSDHVAGDVWDGSYDPAMGQSLSSADAISMSHAIDRGLNAPNIADLLVSVQRRMEDGVADFGYKDNLVIDITPKTIKMLREFAEVAGNSDGFRIE